MKLTAPRLMERSQITWQARGELPQNEHERANAIALDYADFRAKMLNQTADFRELHQRIAEVVIARAEKQKTSAMMRYVISARL
jgi:hypothetical protein